MATKKAKKIKARQTKRRVRRAAKARKQKREAKKVEKFYVHPVKLHQQHTEALRKVAAERELPVSVFVREVVLAAVRKAGGKVDDKLIYHAPGRRAKE